MEVGGLPGLREHRGGRRHLLADLHSEGLQTSFVQPVDPLCGRGHRQHMVKILEWVDELGELDTEGVSASLHEEASDARREDSSLPSLPVSVALANAPDQHQGYFRVPKVLDQGSK